MSGGSGKSSLYHMQYLFSQGVWLFSLPLPIPAVWFPKEGMHLVETTGFDFCETNMQNLPQLIGRIHSI